MPSLRTDSITLDTPSSLLKVSAKRYTHPVSRNLEGFTLLFAHCVAGHKEQWEPTISAIINTQQLKHPASRIREAWGFDWQNHGDSAVLNHQALLDREEGISAYEWAAAIYSFVNSSVMNGHRLVAVGHSAGCGAMLLTTKSIPASTYQSIILIEPTIVNEELWREHFPERIKKMGLVVSSTAVRKDTWGSKHAAKEYFSKRWPWNTWDPRVLDLYCEHGLKPLKRDQPNGGVTLKCDKKQEAVTYPDINPYFDSAAHLSEISHTTPIHFIWGEKNDFVPDWIQCSLDDASQGRVAASVTEIKDAGHFVLQERPEGLAHAICDILDGILMHARSRL